MRLLLNSTHSAFILRSLRLNPDQSGLLFLTQTCSRNVYSHEMATKRPHKTLTLAEKYNILQQLDNGITGSQLAKKYGIGTSTISDIKKNSEKIKRYVDNSTSDGPFRKKTLKEGEFPEMEAELWTWFKKQKDKQVVMSSNLLSEKAKELYVKYYGNNKFKASQGWLKNFKKRHNISQEKLIDEHPVSRPGQFLTKLRAKINELQLLPKQIYVLEGSALFWKIVPFGPETNRAKIKFLACTNIDGTHKLKLVVIGKDKYQRRLKHALIPTEYHSDQNGEMLSAVLQTWFHNSFVEQTRHFLANNSINNKSLLLVTTPFGCELETTLTDNDGKITTMFLPQNFAERIQTYHQNIISLIKLNYRKNLLVNILCFEDSDISESLNKITFKDCMFHLAIAWDQVSNTSIKNCYDFIFLKTEDEEEMIPLLDYDSEYLELLTVFKDKLSKSSLKEEKDEITEIIEMLKYIENELELNENIAIEDVDRENSGESDIKEEEIELEVKNEDAINSFDICLQWAEKHGAELNDLMTLRRLKLKSMYEKQKTLNHIDQLTLKSDYF